jgi:hypothetical protein
MEIEFGGSFDYSSIKTPLPGFTTQNLPSPTRRGTDLNFSSRQGEVRQTRVNLFFVTPLEDLVK